jgi:nardilysin
MIQVQVLETPIKSEGDKKDYRLIKLPNGLKALLIHFNEDTDSESDDIAAMALVVKVGSYDEPKTALGLAHFLEHMLFMGSEKYPQENGYDEFISSNGGKSNAFTSNEYTSYFYSLSEESFPKSVDMFANMFISPLLLKNAMQREREAVDSEYQMNTSDNERLIETILKSFIIEDHPASQFNIGNLKTLKEDITDENLHAALLKLFEKYAGNKMSMAIQSKRSLDEMQELVVECFSAIKSGTDEVAQPMAIDEIFKPEFYSNMVYMKPKTAVKELRLTWTFPSMKKLYKKSPIEFIATIFKNTDKCGLKANLKDRHLIKSLSFESFEENSQFLMPQLSITMTDQGSEKIDEILEAIFSYLLMIKEAPIEDLERLFNEQKTQNELSFKFHKEEDSVRNVYGFAPKMMFYDDVDILRGKTLYSEFDGALITDTINRLNERKFNLLILNSDHGSFPKKEEWFGAEYDEVEFPERYQQLWDQRKTNAEFFLEKPNPFMATNFEIHVNEAESPVS